MASPARDRRSWATQPKRTRRPSARNGTIKEDAAVERYFHEPAALEFGPNIAPRAASAPATGSRSTRLHQIAAPSPERQQSALNRAEDAPAKIGG
jgi:hypothetical protein